MREIKFRAWDLRGLPWKRKMLQWEALVDSRVFNLPYIFSYGGIDGKWIPMQFTGLYDKNGKEIYEGDILKQFPGFGCEWETRKGTVKYEYASFWFATGNQAFILDNHDCQFEIIGNIYENHPEFQEGIQ